MDKLFYLVYDSNLLLKIIALDSLYISLQFLLGFLNRNLTDSQIINKSNTLYNFTTLDRYIYYFIIYSLFNIINIFFWIPEFYSNLIYFIFLLLAFPYFVNKILKLELFKIIINQKKYIIKKIISKIFTAIIKFYGKIYLNRDIQIKYTEIFILIKDYDSAINYLLITIKNIIIILLISYIKYYTANYYYYLLKQIYNYKTGNLLESFNSESAKKYLLDIIDQKNWQELTKPAAYKAILILFQASDGNFLSETITDFNFKLAKFFCIWSLSSIFSQIYLIPILNLIMLVYKSKFNIPDLVFNLVGLLVGYFYNSYLLINIICHFGKNIFINKFTRIISRMVYKFIKKFYGFQKIIISYLLFDIYLIIFSYFPKNYYLLFLNIFYIIISSNFARENIYFGILILSTINSNHKLYQIIFNSIILFLLDILKPEKYIFKTSPPKLILNSKINIIENYIQKN